jgi:GNAT superfamily N-acetyltransferase
MTLEQTIEIAVLDAAAADDSGLMSAIADLINDVYVVAEDGLWVEGARRTSVDEIREMTRAGEIVVARSGAAVAGCVRAHRLAAELSEFGMLAAALNHRSTGVGRRLVEFVERRSLDAGRTTMQLELLVPREWKHPSKVFLASWYGRMGYRLVRTGRIEEAYPHLGPLLATPCDLEVYHKDLRALTTPRQD